LPKRRRWTPVRGEANRVYDPLERAALGALDLVGRVVFGAARVRAPEAQPRKPLPKVVHGFEDAPEDDR